LAIGHPPRRTIIYQADLHNKKKSKRTEFLESG